ncbi:hypothetical protein K6119_17420 [Paracrocinitomix mangrovi]|uniref:hypothetical protein n=1 Tax=Paracrocinitomix mangrovi TaxID=2862509 RepID=UPI001C8D19B8|nr:hypothetical protein [Paracrocinitomix mangrovi]UKN01507.1 hypothetical protein K6119_17420 [Paracrocinitomix mangrovi]
MRYFLSIMALLAIIYSCGDSKNRKDITDEGVVMQSEELDTCFCSELLSDSTGILTKENKAYTGICFENYPGTDTKYIEKSIMDGKIHGKITYYDKAGEVMLEQVYKEGNKKRSGNVEVLNCECSELEKINNENSNVPTKYKLDDISYTGTCTEKYPKSDQVYVKMTFKNGILDGHTVYYNKDGSTLLIENYINGILLSAIH